MMDIAHKKGCTYKDRVGGHIKRYHRIEAKDDYQNRRRQRNKEAIQEDNTVLEKLQIAAKPNGVRVIRHYLGSHCTLTTFQEYYL